jgi:hypothetical protein
MDARYHAAEQKREIEQLDQQQKIRVLELARSKAENAKQQIQLSRKDLWLLLVTVTSSDTQRQRVSTEKSGKATCDWPIGR